MATPLSTFANVDMGGDILCVKAIRTGFNNPGVSSGTANTLLASMPQQFVNTGAALTMTADTHLGVNIFLNNATGAITLPAATGTGNVYLIVVTVASTAATITASGSDKIAGVAVMGTAAGTAPNAFSIATGTTISLNGTTKGGVVGTTITLTDVSSALWLVEANMIGTGTPITPFT